MIKKINKKQVANDFIMHIVAFSIAEEGAQGNPGRILFLTDKCEIYESSIYDKKTDELTKVYRSFNKCIKYIADRKNNIPEGIKYKYMGMGNHLFIVEWLDFLLDKEIPLEFLPGDIYEVWIEKCLNILKKNNHKKKLLKRKIVIQKV